MTAERPIFFLWEILVIIHTFLGGLLFGDTISNKTIFSPLYGFAVIVYLAVLVGLVNAYNFKTGKLRSSNYLLLMFICSFATLLLFMALRFISAS